MLSCPPLLVHAKWHCRVEFGPKRVMLDPMEEFLCQAISGKTEIELPLGPESCEDKIYASTKDQVNLKVTMSYNWFVMFSCR